MARSTREVSLSNSGTDGSSTNSRILVHTNWDFVIGEETVFKIDEPNTNLCLDAGLRAYPLVTTAADVEEQYNGSPLKLWECLGDVPQQKWLVTNDGQFKLSGTSE